MFDRGKVGRSGFDADPQVAALQQRFRQLDVDERFGIFDRQAACQRAAVIASPREDRRRFAFGETRLVPVRAVRIRRLARARFVEPGDLRGVEIPADRAEILHELFLVARADQVLPHYRLADSGICALMPQRRLVPLRVRAFADFLAEKLGGTPPWERNAA